MLCLLALGNSIEAWHILAAHDPQHHCAAPREFVHEDMDRKEVEG